MSVVLFVLLLNYFLLTYTCCEKETGDGCLLSTKEIGVCEKFSKCPYAQNLVRNRGRPETCGFVGLEPIVCCTYSPDEPSPVIVQPVIENDRIRSGKKPGEISRKVCRDMYEGLFSITVVGGEPALAKEFPHMAIVGYGEGDSVEWNCGGSLISDKFVLTAAHCLRSSELGDARLVRIGDLDLSNEEEDAAPQDFTVIRRIPHPEYNPPSRYNDIALMELDHKVSQTLYASPACLYTEKELVQTTMTATGWGNNNFAGSPSTVLIKVELDYVPNYKCNGNYQSISPSVLSNGIDDNRQICAGGVVGRDTCQGDSGGPLQIFNKTLSNVYKVHMIVGVTSFGKACGVAPIPAVYTRVSYYLPWIESIVWPNETLEN